MVLQKDKSQLHSYYSNFRADEPITQCPNNLLQSRELFSLKTITRKEPSENSTAENELITFRRFCFTSLK